MSGKIKEGQRQREKVSRNYETGTIFLIKLLTGFALYITLRIVLSYVLMQRFGMLRLWTRPVVEEACLIFTAFVVGVSPWLKYHRLNLAASAWIYALSCITFVLWFTYLLNLGHRQEVDATLGVLPVVVPYTLFITLYLIKTDEVRNKIMVSLVSLLLLTVWSIDLPRTFNKSFDLQKTVTAQTVWTHDFLDKHVAGDLPDPQGDNSYQLETVDLNPQAYSVSDSLPDMTQLAYVREIRLQMNASREDLKTSEQELLLTELDDIHYHYLYKHMTRRRVVFRDFEFDGKIIYKAVDDRGRTWFLDNLSVTKRSMKTNEEN